MRPVTDRLRLGMEQEGVAMFSSQVLVGGAITISQYDHPNHEIGNQ